MMTITDLESARLVLVADLDSAKTQAERNRSGQFATPPDLAADIITRAVSMLPPLCKIRFLEPGFGTGPFFSALLRHVPENRIEAATGYEIDCHYADPAMRLWSGTTMDLRLADFTEADPPKRPADRYNLVVCNPPYVRHHHLSQSKKHELQASVFRRANFRMNGLGGLYTYFLVLSQAWMQEGAVGAWLIPSEFMDVNYGRKVREFLLERVTLEHVHRFDPNEVQFGDALVSSCIVLFRNSSPTPNHKIQFTFGGTLAQPVRTDRIGLTDLRSIPKWNALGENGLDLKTRPNRVTLADLFDITRGVATGCNSFFILSPEQAEKSHVPGEFLRPILPGPRNLDTDEIFADESGEPQIRERRYLLSCNLPEDVVMRTHPALWAYLQHGIEQEVNRRYICRHREPWYAQDSRRPALFLCTYMGRRTVEGSSPFRFVLNHSTAVAANVYLMVYPKPPLARLLSAHPALRRIVWEGLCSITAEEMMKAGRVYGGGLHKLEPKELANVPADALLPLLPTRPEITKEAQLEMGDTPLWSK